MGFLNFSIRRGLLCAAAMLVALPIGLSSLSMTNGALAGDLLWTGDDITSPEYWDFASANWTGDSTVYSDGDDVTFDDTGSNANEILVLGDALMGVNPNSVTVDNSTGHDYIIGGSGYQGSIQGSTGITKNGTGVLRINNPNSFTGVVTINGGMLRIGASASAEGCSLGASDGGTVVNSGGTLDINGKNIVYNNMADMITIAGTGVGTGSDAGALVNTSNNEGTVKYVTLAADATIGATVNTLSILGVPEDLGLFDAGGHTLTKVGSASLSLRFVQFQNLGDIDIVEGTLNFSSTDYGDSSHAITIRAGATLRSWNDARIAGYETITISSDIVSYGGAMYQKGYGTAPGSPHVYSGDIQLLGDADTTVTVSASGSTPIMTVFSGDVSGTRGIVKEDWRTLVLQGTNTYSGDTTINKGTIALEGSATLDSPNILLTKYAPALLTDNSKFDVTGLTAGSFTLASGQRVKGVGNVVGNLVAGAGSILEPGLDDDASVGPMHIVGGDLTLLDGALLNFELDDPADSATSDRILMGDYDTENPGQLISGGVLSLNSQEFADFTFTPLTNFGVGIYTLIDAGSISGSLGASVSGTIDGLLGTLSISDTDLILTVTSDAPVVPGDTDNDGDVDQDDAATLAGNWGTQVTNGRFDGDFNDDTWVNAADAAVLAANWTGPLANESAPVPEPSILAMMACLSAIFFVRKRGG